MKISSAIAIAILSGIVGIYTGALLVAFSLINDLSFIDIASIAIASCALGLTVWHGYKTQKHHKLSVKPHLILRATADALLKNNYSISISNDGLGPALFNEISVYFDDEVVPCSRNSNLRYLANLIKAISGLEADYSFADLNHSEAISPNDDMQLMNINFEVISDEDKGKLLKLFKRINRRTRIVITYRSMYDEDCIPLDDTV